MRESGIPDDVFELRERELFLSADETPGWAVGHRARMALAHLLVEIHEDDQFPAGVVDISRNGDPTIIRKVAIWHLGVIANRAIGSARCLIACGYAPEAKVPIRRLTEAVIRARATADDHSGDHARAWLAGRPLGTPARLHRRYGARGNDAAIFSTQAHAEVGGLDDLSRLDGTEDSYLLVTPHRDELACKVAELLMKMAASQVLVLAYVLVDTFDRLLTEGTARELNELGVMVDTKKPIFNHRITEPQSDAGSRPA